MEEIAILALVSLAGIAVGLALWYRIRGPAQRRRGQIWRAVSVSLCVLSLVALSVYELMNSRTFQLFGQIVPRVETSQPVVALTFDDGPAPQYTEQVLSILHDFRVPATFFVIGRELEANPELCRQMVAQGHELGNHTFAHTPMVLTSLSFVREEIERTDALIRNCGYHGVIHFRPPNAKKLIVLPYYLQATGRPDILWDVEPDSYPEIANRADGIVAYVLEHARPGSIILLHVQNGSRTESMDAVPGIVKGLHEKGYGFVTVSELLAAQSNEPIE